jgi:hypothetical protein
MDRVVRLTYLERVYTFRVDPEPPLAFWRVEVQGMPSYRSPIRVTGHETPAFFRGMALATIRHFDTG